MENDMKECDNKSCTAESCENCQSKGKGGISKEKLNSMSSVKKVIAVVSGKGGVGKSMITSSLAATLANRGHKVGILDGDITGPSIPKMFGIKEKAMGNEDGIFPGETPNGIRIMSVNLMLENEDDPVIWRGPVIGGVVKQFFTDVIWGELDYMLIDMPPGTGDVPLTVFQSIPVDGIIIVTSPQDLVNLIVKKAYKMADAMNIPVLGIIENYSYLECPDCGSKIDIFGKSNIDEKAGEMGIKVLGKVPVMPEIARMADEGTFYKMNSGYINDAIELIEKD